MRDTKLSYQTWVVAIYILETGIKGTSSIKLHRDLDKAQKSAWYLAHRIRKAWDTRLKPFMGTAEVDETYVGGKEKNKHFDKKLRAGYSAVGKTAVVGAKNRETKRVQAQVVADATAKTLTGFVYDTSDEETQIYADDARAYQELKRAAHVTVKHSVMEYVNGMAHINGIESFWALLTRGYYATCHKTYPKHLQRYVNEFVGQHNARHLDTETQMERTTKGAGWKRHHVPKACA